MNESRESLRSSEIAPKRLPVLKGSGVEEEVAMLGLAVGVVTVVVELFVFFDFVFLFFFPLWEFFDM